MKLLRCSSGGCNWCGGRQLVGWHRPCGSTDGTLTGGLSPSGRGVGAQTLGVELKPELTATACALQHSAHCDIQGSFTTDLQFVIFGATDREWTATGCPLFRALCSSVRRTIEKQC